MKNLIEFKNDLKAMDTISNFTRMWYCSAKQLSPNMFTYCFDYKTSSLIEFHDDGCVTEYFNIDEIKDIDLCNEKQGFYGKWKFENEVRWKLHSLMMMEFHGVMPKSMLG